MARRRGEPAPPALPAAPVIYEQTLTRVPILSLSEHPDNPRQGDTGAVHGLIQDNGFYGALIVQRSSNYVLAGNTRLRALRALGVAEVPVIYLDVDDEVAHRILLGDNRASDLATYDDGTLLAQLERLLATSRGLAGTGYDGDTMDELKRLLAREPDDDGVPVNLGQLLAATEVTIADPLHAVEPGQTWRLGPHRLFVVDPQTEWARFVGALRGNALLCIYPGPLVPLSAPAEDRPLVLVQPDPYIAGHLLDRWAEQKGETSLRCLSKRQAVA